MDELLTSIFLLPMTLAAMVILTPLAYLFAFPIAVIPSVITGCIYGVYLDEFGSSENPTALRRLLVGMGLGFCVTVAFAVLSGGKLHHGWTVLGLPGAFAGGSCALLIAGRLYRWLFPNTPNPRSSD